MISKLTFWCSLVTLSICVAVCLTGQQASLGEITVKTLIVQDPDNQDDVLILGELLDGETGMRFLNPAVFNNLTVDPESVVMDIFRVEDGSFLRHSVFRVTEQAASIYFNGTNGKDTLLFAGSSDKPDEAFAGVVLREKRFNSESALMVDNNGARFLMGSLDDLKAVWP